MNRRHFIKLGLYSSIATLASAGMIFPSGRANAAPISPRTLVNIMLEGGADLRYVFVPDPGNDPSYVNSFWEARKTLYKAYSNYASLFNAEYTPVTDPVSGLRFGIHNTCGWLAQQFKAGNVAIVANVFGSLNRRHDHSQLIVYTGDTQANRLDVQRDGWGGRFASASGATSKIIAVTDQISVLCQSLDPVDRLGRVIHAKNMRNISLPDVNSAISIVDERNIMSRALMAYYQARGQEIVTEKPSNWPYRRFFQHNAALRAFGNSIKTRLDEHPMPQPIASLDLKSDAFELQCRNLYDSYYVQDILGSNLVSMMYTGWDHHKSLQSRINMALSDIFGVNGGLATVTTQLETDSIGGSSNMVFNFNSDFGRQLAANGSAGTDHGRGTYSIVVGAAVNGGIYGDMFPIREAMPDSADSLGRAPLQISGADIQGLTSFERILARSCDWAVPGTGSQVFPGASASSLEAGVDLANMFTA